MRYWETAYAVTDRPSVGQDFAQIWRAADKVVYADKKVSITLHAGYATHDNDKRRSVLSLTEAGWTMHDEVAPMARAREREVLARLDAEEQAWLNRILDKLQP